MMNREDIIDAALEIADAIRIPAMDAADVFAGLALTGMLATGNPQTADKGKWARQAYGFADAMLAERDRRRAEHAA